jgi:pimeloyl-ACP methyl ester carboxylesterase
VAPGETPLVVGHSFGGVIASVYASRYPVRGVVNVDQALKVAPFPPEIVDVLHGDGFEGFLRGLFAQLRGELDEAVAQEVEARRTLRRDVLLGNWSPLLNLDSDALDRWIDGILDFPEPRPYLSVHGVDPGEDYVVWLKERVPDALVEVAPYATHYPHLADPDWFVDRLVAFDATT